MSDDRTLAVYAEMAGAYAARFDKAKPDRALAGFISALPAGAEVLDLGCGTGQATRLMLDAGLTVHAVDASPEMAAIARDKHGLQVDVAGFDSIDALAAYDGIWANFSLLHCPKADMPGHLERLRGALRPGGRLHLGLKTGEGETRDALGRFYAYYSDAEISGLLAAAGFTVIDRVFGAEAGLDGTLSPYILLTATA